MPGGAAGLQTRWGASAAPGLVRLQLLSATPTTPARFTNAPLACDSGSHIPAQIPASNTVTAPHDWRMPPANPRFEHRAWQPSVAVLFHPPHPLALSDT